MVVYGGIIFVTNYNVTEQSLVCSAKYQLIFKTSAVECHCASCGQSDAVTV